MNQYTMYYYSNANYTAPGRPISHGLFNCLADNEYLTQLKLSSCWDLTPIMESAKSNDWTVALSMVQREVVGNTRHKETILSGVRGYIHEDQWPSATRLWLKHSGRLKRLTSDQRHSLLGFRVYLSTQNPTTILLGPVWRYMKDGDQDRFLCQITITEEEWEMYYMRMSNAEEASFCINNSISVPLPPRMVLLYLTSGDEDYANTMARIIAAYRSAHPVEAAQTAITPEWSPFPLPAYDTPHFYRFMAQWCLDNLDTKDYANDLHYYTVEGTDNDDTSSHSAGDDQ